MIAEIWKIPCAPTPALFAVQEPAGALAELGLEHEDEMSGWVNM